MYTISREIQIDMGHRIAGHGSKCRNVHGHRYRVIAECVGGLIPAGEQVGMVADFGFLKGAMIDHIHDPCDHAMCLDVNDQDMLGMFFDSMSVNVLRQDIKSHISFRLDGLYDLAVYVVDFPPTAENLARHWFERLQDSVLMLSEKNASLLSVTVHETPNCVARYISP